MGLYPALAHMVSRNEIKESPVIGTRNIHVPVSHPVSISMYQI